MPLSNLPIPQFYQGRTLNFAHRGASTVAPENTLAAFTIAAHEGYDGVELDVQLSKDGEVIVFHDKTLDRTTNGSGLVQEQTVSELRKLDAGAWFADSFAGETIPILADVFEQFGNKLLLSVELKGQDETLAQRTVQLIEAYQLRSSIIVSSFNNRLLRQVHRENKHIAVGRLLQPTTLLLNGLENRLRNLTDGKPVAFHLHHSTVNAKVIRWAHKQKCRVNAWTVNEREEIIRMRDLGVDMIISDKPEIVHAVLRGEL